MRLEMPKRSIAELTHIVLKVEHGIIDHVRPGSKQGMVHTPLKFEFKSRIQDLTQITGSDKTIPNEFGAYMRDYLLLSLL